MDPRFAQIFEDPQNAVFQVVFYPDRIYGAPYLNATRSSRYRYDVLEVRGYLDIAVLTGTVFLDGRAFANFLRVEYRGSRLVEALRDKNRFLGDCVLAWVRMTANGKSAETRVNLHRDRWIGAFQVEIWSRLDPPETLDHDYSVLDMMGRDGQITRVPAFDDLLADVRAVTSVELAFREPMLYAPFGTAISDEQAAWDNNFTRSHQQPNSSEPSSQANTVGDKNYRLDFQRGWYQHLDDIQPVFYRNAMMEAQRNPDARDDNIIAMRWLFQRELGGSMVFFHHVTVPPGKVEGNHQHLGSEELYYVVEGEGTAFLRVGDDPKLDADPAFPTETREVFGLGPREFKAIPVRPGSMIFTKSGGMHGIHNKSGSQDLKFVAFLYHSR
jgi:oxalate decarboxylase/phosphoglucose isomerase-like protein (cupin superfamily)